MHCHAYFLQHKITPLHEAVLRNNHTVLREIINVIPDNDLPAVNAENREQQIRDCCRDRHKEAGLSLINKKNKVS